jgi:hypothetical protein
VSGEQLAGVGEAVGRAAGRELTGWRREHPSASLAELEVAVDGALGAARRRLLAEMASEQEEAPAVCAQCGGPLVRRGRKPRAVLIAQSAEPLGLDRAYWRCSSCGTSLFPPG